MRALLWLAMGLLTACESIEPSGALFEPVVESAPEPAPAPDGSVPVEPGGFDFDADARPEVEPPTDAELDPSTVAEGLGLGVVGLVSPTPAPLPPSSVAPAPTGWTPLQPLDGSFGVRLVSTVPDAQPPRAILGMPDGTEMVVTPGALIPEARIVVLAIGRDAVQVAEIVPAGDHARVETRILEPLFRQGMSPR